MERTYAVELTGLGSLSREQAAQKLAVKFGLPVSTTAKMVANPPVIVKRGLSNEKRQTYLKALLGIGLQVATQCEQTGERVQHGPAVAPALELGRPPTGGLTVGSTVGSGGGSTSAPLVVESRTYSIELLGFHGRAAGEVARDFARAFSIPLATATDLLKRAPVSVKRRVPPDKLSKYVSRLVKIGIEVTTRCEQTGAIERHGSSSGAPPASLAISSEISLVKARSITDSPIPEAAPPPRLSLGPSSGERPPLTDLGPPKSGPGSPAASADAGAEHRPGDEPFYDPDAESEEPTGKRSFAIPGWVAKTSWVGLICLYFLIKGVYNCVTYEDPAKSVSGHIVNNHVRMEMTLNQSWKHLTTRDNTVVRPFNAEIPPTTYSMYFRGSDWDNPSALMLVGFIPGGATFGHGQLSLSVEEVTRLIDDIKLFEWSVGRASCQVWLDNEKFGECLLGVNVMNSSPVEALFYISESHGNLYGLLFHHKDGVDVLGAEIEQILESVVMH